MLVGYIEYPQGFQQWLHKPIWEEILAWLRTGMDQLPDGEHVIRGRDVYVNIHTAVTVAREEGVFEAHQEYIDLHYCIDGGEIIEWAPTDTLSIKKPYDKEKDYAFYETPPEAASCRLQKNMFALFLPGEAHMPKVTDGTNTQVRKAVVKIRKSVL